MTVGNDIFAFISTTVKKAVYLRRTRKFPLSCRSPGARWQGQIWCDARGFADSSNGELCPDDFCSQQNTEMTTNLFLTIGLGLACVSRVMDARGSLLSLLRSRSSGCHATLPRKERGSVAWHPEGRLRRRLGLARQEGIVRVAQADGPVRLWSHECLATSKVHP